MMQHKKNGYILVMALLMISLAILMTSVMFDRGGSYVPYMRIVIDRQKAKNVVLGGLALITSQLSKEVKPEKKDESKQVQKPTEDQEAKQLLQTILPTLNRWQTFELDEIRDGIDATLQVCLMSEEGKLNINAFFDFETQKFIDEGKGDKDGRKLLETLFGRIEKHIKAKELLKSLEQFLKKRGYPLNDITELLTIKSFEPFKRTVYYEPSKDVSLALTDIFTVHSKTTTVEPWLLSASMQLLLGVPKGQKEDVKKRTESMEQWLQSFKIKAQWQKDWDMRLKNIHGVEIKSLPKGIVPLFGDTFVSTYFSALIYCKVGDATQRLYAILERIKKSHDTKTVYDVKVRKCYWL